MLRVKPCPRCHNCHIENLMVIPIGMMLLIRAEIEAAETYEESVAYENEWCPLPRTGYISPHSTYKPVDIRSLVFG